MKKPSSLFDWILLGLLGIFIYEVIKQIQAAQTTGANLITAFTNAIPNFIADVGAIIAAPFKALTGGTSSIENAITGAGASVSSGITSGIGGIFSSIWNFILSILLLPLTILSNLTGGAAGVAGAIGTVALGPGASLAAAIAPTQNVTGFNDGTDPTIAPVPDSGANTISNGGSASTGGNFSVTNGAGASSTGYQ